MTLRDIARVFSRHRKKMILFATASVAIAFGWIIMAPRTYESVAKLYVRLGREQVTLDPTATTGPTMNLYQTHENEINSTLQILDSRQIAEQVVDAIGADIILADADPESDKGSQPSKSLLAGVKESLMGGLKTVLRVEPQSERYRAIRALQQRVKIWSPANSGVLVIQARSGDPRLAQRIAQEWSEIFQTEYVRLTHTEGSFEFFQRQVTTLGPELEKAEKNLQQAKDSAGLVSVAGQQQVLENRIGSLRLQAAANQAAKASAQANAEQLAAKMKTVPRLILAEQMTGVSDDAYNRMREKLYELELTEADLKSRYTDQHPAVISVVRKRAEAKNILSNRADSRAHSTETPNPIYQSLQQLLLTEQARVESLSAEGRALNEQLELAHKDLQALNAYEIKLAALTRKRDILQDNYRTHMAKLEQARTNEALGKDHISSVNLLQKAYLDEKPVSPSRAIVMALGLVVAVLGGMGMALLAEHWNATLPVSAYAQQTAERPVRVAMVRSAPLEACAP